MNPFLLTKSSQTPILRLDLIPAVAESALKLFETAAHNFRAGIDETVEFDPGYQLQEDECFQITDFKVDEHLLKACKQPLSSDRLNSGSLNNLPIQSIVGYKFDDGLEELYFQNFDSRKVIVPGKRFALFATADPSTFQELTSPVLMLDDQLTAIWKNGTLTFKSFHLAKRIFDLSDYFAAATDEQVEKFACHSRFVPNNFKVLQNTSSQWHRKKIALILRSGDLDRNSTQDLIKAADAWGYKLPVKDDRIELPVDKSQLRLLLQFLDEDLYIGPLSRRKLISSGKRVDKRQS